MTYAMKPLACDPRRIKGMSETLIVSHYENNYGGAVKRLNAVADQLGALEFASAPVFLVNGLKREELIATNSMILHELFFASLGAASAPDKDLESALARDFGSVARWKAEFTAMGKALGGGSGWVLLTWSPRREAREPMGIGTCARARRSAADPRARHVRAFLPHRPRRQGRRLCRCVHGRDQLAQRPASLRSMPVMSIGDPRPTVDRRIAAQAD
jgi:superoxide dismutase